MKYLRLLAVGHLAAMFAIGRICAQHDDATMIRRIYDEALTNGRCYQNLQKLCANGPRLSGSEGAARAVQLMQQIMLNDGLQRVQLQPVMVPRWVRGTEEQCIALVNRKPHTLRACALGGSIGTNGQWLTGQVVEIKSWAQMDSLGAALKGKIVFYNRPMDPKPIYTFSAYGACVDQRYHGASRAAKYGAVGVIVRSMSHKIDHHPHTGSMGYENGVEKIPAMAISTADAEWLSTQLRKANTDIQIRMKLNCNTLSDVLSYNVLGEIPGSVSNNIIMVGGHLDAWDNGTGAHDDGAGCVHSIEALRILQAVGYTPKNTLRAVNFMNEENGLKGAQAYADSATKKKETHLIAIESDRGGFTPRGFYVENSTAALQRLHNWRHLLEPYGLHEFKEGGGGADISPLKPQGTVLIGFVPDSQRYFDYHHAPTDTFESINKRELELGAASIAALIYLFDKYGL